jgi:hypothetical protein
MLDWSYNIQSSKRPQVFPVAYKQLCLLGIVDTPSFEYKVTLLPTIRGVTGLQFDDLRFAGQT